MNKHSLLLKIAIFFFIAFIAITFLFNIIEKHEYNNNKEKLQEHYHHIAMYVMRYKLGNITHTQLLEQLDKNNISLINDPQLHQKIKSHVSSNAAICSLGNFYMYEQENFRYIVVPPIFGPILLKDTSIIEIDVSYVWWLYGVFVFIILLLFASITVSLYPLKQLQQQIRRFGEGDVEMNFFSSRKDEIAEVSNEFNKSAKKIKNMLEARKIFLRNITHELKTPITSGKLAIEFLEESKSKDVLNNVFTRLELLLKEFVEIEKITATNHILEKKPYSLRDILDQACDMLFLEPDSIKNNFKNNMLEVNFELFTFVFKNLIDNGIKYSDDNDIYIECDNTQINFITKGEEIEEPLQYYLEAFTKSEKKASQSFGLGLYIVHAILEKHNFTLTYSHINGYNFFTINT